MNSNSRIVMITGCLGFIGSHITRRCLSKGYIVYGIDSETYAANKSYLTEFQKYQNFKYEKIDICNIKKLPYIDVIVNTAAETHVDNSIECSKSFINSNITGVHNILELIKNSSGHKPTLLHFSTDEVYGDILEGSFTETSKLSPSNPYSATKAAADHLIQAFSRTYKIPYIILRPTNNYGIGQYSEKLIPKSIKLISLERRVPLHLKGTPKRTWLHVEDTTDAVMIFLHNSLTHEGRIYNLNGNYETSNFDVVDKICKIMKVETKFFIDLNFERNGIDLRYSIHDDRMQNNTEWYPSRKFDIELPKIVEYHSKNWTW